ncbi:hypothetical protein [Butyrivibrio sp. MC2013]|uniref:hypothetical protein n=1 Tax=Butyrivibrio sp. MC2013 TaxID=1280686 RepID=UPI00042696AA|nr:hypothetical protein [Butyrivibrio sp. MC2013]
MQMDLKDRQLVDFVSEIRRKQEEGKELDELEDLTIRNLNGQGQKMTWRTIRCWNLLL